MTSLHEKHAANGKLTPTILTCTMVMLSPKFGGKRRVKTACSIPWLIKLRSHAPNVRRWPRTSQNFLLQRGTKTVQQPNFHGNMRKIIEIMSHMTYLMNGVDKNTQLNTLKITKIITINVTPLNLSILDSKDLDFLSSLNTQEGMSGFTKFLYIYNYHYHPQLQLVLDPI